MKRILATAVATLMMVAGSAAIAGEFDRQINARKAVMTLRSWNVGTLFAMAKGKMEYDAGAAQAAADNLVALSTMSSGAMWPKGSDSAALPGQTRAKAEIWSTFPAVREKDQALGAAAAKLAAVAGSGLEALQSEVGNVGGACGACHKQFREEE